MPIGDDRERRHDFFAVLYDNRPQGVADSLWAVGHEDETSGGQQEQEWYSGVQFGILL